MDVKARAAYAWGRIVSLFTPRKPDIEVEVEEFEEMKDSTFSREPVEAEQPVGESVITDEIVSFEPMSPMVSDTVNEAEPSRGETTEGTLPSRMTEEYKAWLRERMEEA